MMARCVRLTISEVGLREEMEKCEDLPSCTQVGAVVVFGPGNSLQSHMECYGHWIGLGEFLQETPLFNGKNHGFL